MIADHEKLFDMKMFLSFLSFTFSFLVFFLFLGWLAFLVFLCRLFFPLSFWFISFSFLFTISLTSRLLLLIRDIIFFSPLFHFFLILFIFRIYLIPEFIHLCLRQIFPLFLNKFLNINILILEIMQSLMVIP